MTNLRDKLRDVVKDYSGDLNEITELDMLDDIMETIKDCFEKVLN